ncbi:unnamed protein product [Phytomonas sp. EM1]|nr:unnamed protein product [Phytomonas sp. EM1]|eukprot:CCW60031.1 unnamed protein product [Phytomonas sp. isolate EM1]
MDSPVIVKEVFQLNSIPGGLRPGTISFKNVTIDGEKYVCVRDVQENGQTSLVIADLVKQESMRNNIKDAEAAIMNPNSKILALRSGRNMQIFDVDASKRLKALVFHDDILFWRWVDAETVGIVTATTVYHWRLNTAPDTPPERVFDRGEDYGASVQILSYHVDEKKKWLVLTGVTRDGTSTVGKAFLYSVENKSSRVLSGHACNFITTTVPNESRPCDIMCMAWNSPQEGGQVMIMELPTSEKMDLTLTRRVYSVRMQEGDFPIVMHMSERHKLLTVVTSRGAYVLMDIFTGTILATQQFAPAVIFCGAEDRTTGGIICVSSQGAVIRVAPNDASIIPFVKNHMQNPQLAIRIAESANLGGVDDLFRTQLESYLQSGNVEAAIRMCLRAPGGALRTPEVLRRFMQLPQQPGQPPAISTYFKLVLAETKLNEFESVELARAVLPKGGIGFVKQQLDEGKLTPNTELADLVQRLDPDMAMKIYHQNSSHAKVVNVLLQSNQTQKAVEYCKQTKFSPDWRVIMGNFIRANPQDAVSLGLMLYREMGDKPVLSAEEILDMLVSTQNIQQATEFLLEVLRDHNDESTIDFQTKLLEINLKYSHPSVAEKIFARGICLHYDPIKLAPLCERAGLYHRAIDCYIIAQREDLNANNLVNIRRCLEQYHTLSPEWMLEFFGKLNKEEGLVCLSDLCKNHKQNFKVIVQVATKYSDALGSRDLINFFLEKGLFEILYYYLGAIVPYTKDPEVHFRYIEAAAEMGQIQELERMTRESPCYEPERTKSYLKAKGLTNVWPFINVCDAHDMVNEMVHYLVDTGNESCIEQYVMRRSPGKTPQVVQALIECHKSEDYIKSVLSAAGAMCPIQELVDVAENTGRMSLIREWVQDRCSEKKTDAALFNALGKIYVDSGENPEAFLLENEYYDPMVLGKYCENTDPNLAYIAYMRGNCSEAIVKLCQKNNMYNHLARYLVKAQNLDLWAGVLASDTPERKLLVEAVHQTALPEAQVSEEVSTTVRAFMSANLIEELTSLLEQIVLYGQFRKNRYLENLLIMSAVRTRKDKVMEYVMSLENYDAANIANLAIGAELYEVAFVVYDRHNMKKEAMMVLLENLKDLSRARTFAQKLDLPEAWGILGVYLVKEDDMHDGVECLIRGKNADAVADVMAAAERTKQYADLVKYLLMARTCSRSKDGKIDTALAFTYAKTGQIVKLEEFLKDTHNVKIGDIADKCFNEGLYDSARVLCRLANNYARLATTELKLNNLAAAVEAANKARLVQTYKEVNMACLLAGEMKLAGICALPVLLKVEELSGMADRYESRGLWEDLLTVLRTAAGTQGAHMGIFTEIGVLLARYNPEKLLEHINIYPRKINTHKMVSVCELYHHWLPLRVLHVNNEDWMAAVNTMMKHYADAWDHEVFKDAVLRMGSNDVVYSAIGFYMKTHPELLNDFLSSIFKKVEPERVMVEVEKYAPIYLIRTYLEAIQERNLKKVNETLNDLYIEGEDFDALRHSIESYDNFDFEKLSSRLEKMELFEFRKIALFLHRKNKNYMHAIRIAKENKLYQYAIDTASESGDTALAEELLDYFVKDHPEFFASCLYTCYDILDPTVVMEKAWRNQRTDIAMPYLIQTMQSCMSKINRLERALSDEHAAAREAARRLGPAEGVNRPLMIEATAAGFGPGAPPMPMPSQPQQQPSYANMGHFGTGRPF